MLSRISALVPLRSQRTLLAKSRSRLDASRSFHTSTLLSEWEVFDQLAAKPAETVHFKTEDGKKSRKIGKKKWMDMSAKDHQPQPQPSLRRTKVKQDVFSKTLDTDQSNKNNTSVVPAHRKKSKAKASLTEPALKAESQVIPTEEIKSNKQKTSPKPTFIPKQSPEHELSGRKMVEYIRARDHDNAIALYKENENAYTYFQVRSLLNVCYSHKHLDVALELTAKLSSQSGKHASVPEQALLSLIRCYSAVDTPPSLRSLHIKKAKNAIKQMHSLNMEPRLRTYEPILSSLCRSSDMYGLLDLIDEMKIADVYLKELQIMMILASIINIDNISYKTQKRLKNIIDSNTAGMRDIPVELLHKLLAAYHTPHLDSIYDDTSSLKNGLLRINGSKYEKDHHENTNTNPLSLSYWLAKVFGYTGNHSTLSKTYDNNFIPSFGANARDTSHMTLQQIMADRGVMVNNRQDIPGDIVVDRLDMSSSQDDTNGMWSKNSPAVSGTGVGNHQLDERLPRVAVAINSFYSNPLDTHVMTKRALNGGNLLVAVNTIKKNGDGVELSHEYVFKSAQGLLQDLESQSINNQDSYDTNFVNRAQVYKEKYYLHENPSESFKNRRSSAKPAALVEITSTRTGPNYNHNSPSLLNNHNTHIHSCPNCGQRIRKLDLSHEDKHSIRASLQNIARENNQLQSLQTFNDYITKRSERYSSNGQHITYIIDGANVAYHRQNFDGGRFSYKQIELVVEKLKIKITKGNNSASALKAAQSQILILLPHLYVQGHVPNLSKANPTKKFRDKLSRDELAILQRFRDEKLLYVVPQGGNDDWYWMYATVNEGRTNQAYVITNDLMRDHKLAFRNTSNSNICFSRWRESTIMHFDFSHAVEMNKPDTNKPDVMLVQPSYVTREMQYTSRNASSRRLGRIHIPAADRSSWGCFSLDSRDYYDGNNNKLRDLTDIVKLFENNTD
jgi:hypothetical protein